MLEQRIQLSLRTVVWTVSHLFPWCRCCYKYICNSFLEGWLLPEPVYKVPLEINIFLDLTVILKTYHLDLLSNFSAQI